MSFDTPILLIFWKRADLVLQVIQALRPHAPAKIYLASDGPRSDVEGEAYVVQHVRSEVEKAIDWPCQIFRRYSDLNQGCRLGPANAISWLFEEEEEAIILEDDCVPGEDFLPFCSAMLEHFRGDERIWCISAANFQRGVWRGEGSYYFSRYSLTWAWATWRRCWKHVDLDLMSWPSVRDHGGLLNLFENEDERQYWAAIWERMYSVAMPVTWDYQWNYACFINGGLSIVPNVNLVSNIGFGDAGTHCLDAQHPLANWATERLKLLHHPYGFLPDRSADRWLFEFIYRDGGQLQKPQPRWRQVYLEFYYTLSGLAAGLKKRLAHLFCGFGL